MTRAEMINKIAWAEALHSAHPRRLWQVIAETHIQILNTLTTEELKEYYIAMFGKVD